MASSDIIIKGARVHNLKKHLAHAPARQIHRVYGAFRLGKSSLAFDTLYAEGHRRFVESLSSYARMFLGQLDKPDVDSIEGLSPAISIDQKTTSKNPRSTVGTVTEIYDYLRLLYARIGVPHCPVCGEVIKQQSVDEIVSQLTELENGVRFMVLAPVVSAKKGMHEKVFEDASRSGYVRVRVDGSMYDLSEKIELDKNIKHSIDIVVDRLVMQKESIGTRLTDSIETAASLAGGMVRVVILNPDGTEEEADLFAELRLQDARHLARRAGAAHVLVQQPVRRLPRLRRSRRVVRRFARSGHPRQKPVAVRRRDRGQRLQDHRAGQLFRHAVHGAGKEVRLHAPRRSRIFPTRRSVCCCTEI